MRDRFGIDFSDLTKIVLLEKRTLLFGRVAVLPLVPIRLATIFAMIDYFHRDRSKLLTL